MEMMKVPGSALPYPGMCATCGSPNRDCLDLGFTFEDDLIPIERLGAALMCDVCFKLAAQIMGYEPVKEPTPPNEDTLSAEDIKQLTTVQDHVGDIVRYANLVDGAIGRVLLGVYKPDPIISLATADETAGSSKLSDRTDYTDRNPKPEPFAVTRSEGTLGLSEQDDSNVGIEGPDSVPDNNDSESSNAGTGTAREDIFGSIFGSFNKGPAIGRQD